MIPVYDLNKIRYGTDSPTYERAVDLYSKGKVTKFEKTPSGFTAIVLGGQPYRVSISHRSMSQGLCECYLGKQDVLCKHLIALAIFAVLRGAPIPSEHKHILSEVGFCGQMGKLEPDALEDVKRKISEAMRYIKAYNGPSKTWFAYQNSLDEGVARLTNIVSELPASKQTADLLVKLLLKLDKKLMQGGVDDSNGTVGGFMYETAELLKQFADVDSSCVETFKQLCQKDLCFEWPDTLIKRFDEWEE